MKKLISVLLLLSFSGALSAQATGMSDGKLKARLDSILREGTLLYRYERAAWIACDLAAKDPVIKEQFGSYITYEDKGEIKVIVLGEGLQTSVAEYVFKNHADKPKWIKIRNGKLSAREKTLINVRENFLANLHGGNYELTVPHGYSLNFILLPSGNKYKMYILTGTAQPDVIPLGNDYLFVTDKNGKIESWKKFHSKLLPAYTKSEEGNLREITHSHLESTPLITATDLCTFMLYAPLYGVETFSVYSPATGGYMRYHLKENRITVE